MINGLTLLIAIASFFIGRWFQYLLTQSSESKWQLKPQYRYRTQNYKNPK